MVPHERMVVIVGEGGWSANEKKAKNFHQLLNMSSNSSSHDESDKNEAHSKSIAEKENKTNLETGLKSLQPPKKTGEACGSKTDKVQKSPTRFLTNSRPRNTFQETTVENTPGVDGSNWGNAAPTSHSRENIQQNSMFQATGWRDPNFEYERIGTTRDNRTGSIGKSPRKWENGKKMGNWTLICASDIILDNGLTEAEHVKNSVNKLYESNQGLFANFPEFVPLGKIVKINCFTSNYEDKAEVVRAADVLIEKIGNYPYCFYYFRDGKYMYMRTCDKELYERTENNNWRLIDEK